jgi:hypothetical protein
MEKVQQIHVKECALVKLAEELQQQVLSLEGV